MSAPLSRRRFLAATRTASPDAAYWIRVHRPAMACRFEITFDSRDALLVPRAQAALNQIDRIEAELTVFRETSVLVDVNRRAASEPVPLSQPLFDLLARCERLARLTDGTFDITSAPLSRCWGFMRRQGRIPSDREIAEAAATVGMQHVELRADACTVRFLRAGVELNLGAVGKGYALDRVASSLRVAGVRHALLSAGRSSLLAIGGRQRGWCVDVVSPRVDAPMARVFLRNAALGTSGAGEQFVLVDGQRYGHVLDPRSGRPASGVLSASAICGSAADADALSTAFLVGGLDLAKRYCDRHRGVLALITPDDGSGRTVVVGNHRGAEVTTSWAHSSRLP